MQLNPKVYFIPPRPRRSLRVAVYARVSTNHPPIITAEVFKAVQLEKNRRSNIIRDDSGTKRKNTKYSSKHKTN
jgi:hypothetical protein